MGRPAHSIRWVPKVVSEPISTPRAAVIDPPITLVFDAKIKEGRVLIGKLPE